jgi:hypothetical protein
VNQAKTAVILIILPALILSGCIKRVERQAPIDRSSYLPLETGNSYLFSGILGRSEVTGNIGNLYTISHYDSTGRISAWRDVLRTGSGAALRSIVWNSEEPPSVGFEPPLPFSPWSNLVGDTLLYSGAEVRADSANTHLRIMVEFEIMAVETLVTPAGEFENCIKVETSYRTLENSASGRYDGRSALWFAKDVGLVKYVSPYGSGELLKAVVNGVNYP